MKPIIKVVDKIIFGKSITGITLWPFIFVKKGYDKPITLNHEAIHIKQQLETLVIPFYILYFLMWFYNTFITSKVQDAYFLIPFEQEAYDNEKDMDYLKNRKPYAWLKYIFKKKEKR